MIDADMDNYTIMMINGVSKETATMVIGMEVLNVSNIMVAYMPIDLTKACNDDLESSIRELIKGLIR